MQTLPSSLQMERVVFEVDHHVCLYCTVRTVIGNRHFCGNFVLYSSRHLYTYVGIVGILHTRRRDIWRSQFYVRFPQRVLCCNNIQFGMTTYA